jgi:hypothetical protein
MNGQLRFGTVSESCTRMLKSLARPLPDKGSTNAPGLLMWQVVVERSDQTMQPWAGGMIPTKLYSRNADVDTENERCLAKLPDGLVWRASKWSERPVQGAPSWPTVSPSTARIRIALIFRPCTVQVQCDRLGQRAIQESAGQAFPGRAAAVVEGRRARWAVKPTGCQRGAG